VTVDGLALVIIVVGTIEAFIKGLRLIFIASASHEQRDVWLRYARWLVAGLTFQLAADIIETSVTTNWDANREGKSYLGDPHCRSRRHEFQGGCCFAVLLVLSL
jgi:hypothetical protein